MKILYIITKSEAGGAQTHIYQLSKHLAKKGDDVAVMAHPGGWLQRELENSKSQSTNYKQIPNPKTQNTNGVQFYENLYLTNSFNPIHGLRAMREIKKAVEDFRPDLVSCHSSVAGFWARIAIRNRVPTIFTAHGWAFTEGAPQLRRMVAIIAEKIAAKYCEKIICVSDYDRNLALKYKIAPAEKLITIHNGVELSNASAFEKSSELQKTNEEIRIVFVGRLAEPKQQELLAKAYAQLPQELQDKSEVVLIGEGGKRSVVEKVIGKYNLTDKIVLKGSLPRKKVFEELRSSGIFVLISRYEGFPRSILEAMSFGLPIIASDVGGVVEAVSEQNGILLEENSAEEVAKALKKLIQNPQLRDKMGKASYERVRREFSLEKMFGATHNEYKKL